MSMLARLIMMAGKPSNFFVANQSAGASSTGFTMPASGPGGDVLAGDFMVIEYYDAITIGGGAGVAFTTFTFAGTKVSYRQIQPGDLATPFTFSVAGPYLLTVLRGPTSIGTPVRSGSFTADGGPQTVAGFAPTPGAVAIMGFTIGVGTPGEARFGFKGSPPGYEGPFDIVDNELTSGWGWSNALLIEATTYTGSAFIVYGSPGTGVTYRICELF